MEPKGLKRRKKPEDPDRLRDEYGVEIRAVAPIETSERKKRFDRYNGFDAGLHWSKVYKKGERFY